MRHRRRQHALHLVARHSEALQLVSAQGPTADDGGGAEAAFHSEASNGLARERVNTTVVVPTWRLAQWHYEVGRANWTLGNEKKTHDELQQAMRWASRLALPNDTMSKAAGMVQEHGREHPRVRDMLEMPSRGLSRHLSTADYRLSRVQR